MLGSRAGQNRHGRPSIGVEAGSSGLSQCPVVKLSTSSVTCRSWLLVELPAKLSALAVAEHKLPWLVPLWCGSVLFHLPPPRPRPSSTQAMLLNTTTPPPASNATHLTCHQERLLCRIYQAPTSPPGTNRASRRLGPDVVAPLTLWQKGCSRIGGADKADGIFQRPIYCRPSTPLSLDALIAHTTSSHALQPGHFPASMSRLLPGRTIAEAKLLAPPGTNRLL